jgi:hypothetical protein
MEPVGEYQKEQLETLIMVEKACRRLAPRDQARLMAALNDYLHFRTKLSRFLKRHFSSVCNQTCFQSHLSACCSKEGIITFFGDMAVNVALSKPSDIERLQQRLRKENDGQRCIYLGSAGCLWQMKPIVCEMFLCDSAQKEIFAADPALKKKWQAFKKRRKDFTWPDKPVLFDWLEKFFMDAGVRSPLMYLNTSPGLLRVKKKAEKTFNEAAGKGVAPID